MRYFISKKIHKFNENKKKERKKIDKKIQNN